MQNRIDRLENLVLSLMTTEQGATVAHAQAAVNASAQSASNGSRDADVSMNQDESTMHDIGEDDSDVNDVSHAIGIMKVDGSKSFYASDAHWHAILANVGASPPTGPAKVLIHPRLPRSKTTTPATRTTTLLRYDV